MALDRRAVLRRMEADRRGGRRAGPGARHGAMESERRHGRSRRRARLHEAEGKVVAISGDTIPCEGIDRLARDADVLVHCCYMASAEIENEHFRRVAQHTLAAGDTVGKIATRANAKTLVLTHHRPRKDERMLDELANEVARDFSGRIVIGNDLTEIDV